MSQARLNVSLNFFLFKLRVPFLLLQAVLPFYSSPSKKLLTGWSYFLVRNCFSRTLTSTSICSCALTSERQTFSMTNSSVATKIHEALIFKATSRRRSPSTLCSRSMISLIFATSTSDNVSVRLILPHQLLLKFF